MNTKEQFIQKYSLADIFDKTIKMLKYTWKDSIVLSLVGFIPYAAAMATAFYFYFNAIVNIIAQQHEGTAAAAATQWDLMAPLFLALGLLFAASFVYSIAAVFISGCISAKTYHRAHGRQVSFKENFFFILKNKFGKLVLQLLLFIVIYLGIIVASAIAFVIVGVIMGLLVKSAAFVSALIITMMLGIFCVVIWLTIAFGFSLQALVLDDASPAQGILQSFKLVRGSWWRVFGYSLLLGIVMSFAVSLATFPIIMIFLLPVYIQTFESIMKNSSHGLNYLPIMKAMKSIYIPLGISSFIQACGYMLIMPVFKTLFFIDLKFRKGDFGGDRELPQPESEQE